MNENWRNSELTRKTWQLRLFNKSLLKKAKWRQILRCLGPMSDKTGLDIGSDNGVISYLLRCEGGTWDSIDSSEKAVRAIQDMVGERVHRLQGPQLPFKDGEFDVVVIVDMLEHLPNDYGFIKECHRVLKPAGRLIVNVPHAKRRGLLPPLRNVLGQTDDKHGHVRPGYTEAQLFDVLKDGFDVQEMHTYSRFFVEVIDTIVRSLAERKMAPVDGDDAKGPMITGDDYHTMEKTFKAYRLVYPFLLAASFLDALIFFTKGYKLIAQAKRRLWIPRKIPILSDGRSIAEAAINTRIGSAAPF